MGAVYLSELNKLQKLKYSPRNVLNMTPTPTADDLKPTLRKPKERSGSEPRSSGSINKGRRRSYPRSFEIDNVNEEKLCLDKTWKGYKRLLRRGLIVICVMTVIVFALIQGFSYTKFSTFYKIVKRKIYQKLHYSLG